MVNPDDFGDEQWRQLRALRTLTSEVMAEIEGSPTVRYLLWAFRQRCGELASLMAADPDPGGSHFRALQAEFKCCDNIKAYIDDLIVRGRDASQVLGEQERSEMKEDMDGSGQ